MPCQWIASVAIAFWLSPRTWAGNQSRIHPHVWLAIFLGALITSLPVLLVRYHPGRVLTRHAVAVGQMLMSSLLIHFTGGRIETHFHVFGSLAFIHWLFYRDWRVLISASHLVVYVDHLLRSFFTVAGIGLWRPSPHPSGRSFEHAGWVAFKVAFLIISIRTSLREMLTGWRSVRPRWSR